MNPANPVVQTPTSFVDREDELRIVAALLLVQRVRLLTLVGPAGVGKTRLALTAVRHVARHFPDGVLFVDLTPVRDPQQILPMIAHAIGLSDISTLLVLPRLQSFLGARRFLMLLDNFEQALPASAEVAELLAGSPGLHLLVTSRVPLQLRWEHTLRVAPLTVPDAPTTLPIEALLTIPAVALFVERACAKRANFVPTDRDAPLLTTLVQQLDGLPLAIELAAAHMDTLPLAVIARHLAQRIAMLRRDAPDVPDRHRSLQAAMDWGYDLLIASEQRLFRHLGVFVGRVSLAAIAAVIAESDEGRMLVAMAALAEKSLVQPEHESDNDPEPSFVLLETVRQYAQEHLIAQGESEGASRAHAAYFLGLAEQADPALRGQDQLRWYARLEREHDNLRAALRWLLDHGEPAEALRLAGALGHFWWRRGYHIEGVQWLEAALVGAPDADPALRTRALLRLAPILMTRREPDWARRLLEEARESARRREDRTAQAEALTFLGACALFTEEWEEGRRLLREALQIAEELHDDYWVGFILGNLAQIAAAEGDYREAARLDEASVARHLAIGAYTDVTINQFYLALSLQQLGEGHRAARVVREGIRRSALLDNHWHLARGVEAALLVVGEAIASEPGARLLGAGEALNEASGSTFGIMAYFSRLPMPDLRGRTEREGLESAYRAGRTLPFDEIVALALAVLDDFERAASGFAAVEDASRPLADTAPALQPRAAPPAPPAPATAENPLSEREREVLRLVAEGRTNRAVAEALFISPSTVSYHLAAIFNKLSVDTRAQAVAIAVQRDLL